MKIKMVREEDVDMEFSAFEKLNKDLKDAAKILTAGQVRYVVDQYYREQDYRKALASQIKASNDEGEPNALLEWMYAQVRAFENNIRNAMLRYAEASEPGRWLLSVRGIGPVLAAGLLAHLSIEPWRCANPKRSKRISCSEGNPCTPECKREIVHTVGHFWSFAGYNPGVRWEKGKKRPWNARLKVLCWKIGESFMKQSYHDDCIYGKIYLERKEYERAKNEKLEYKEQAEDKLRRFNIGKDTDAYMWYSQGILPPDHIHSRAKRYAVKQFLSDFHRVWYRDKFKKEPPLPYPIAYLEHVHMRQVGEPIPNEEE